MSRCDLSSLKRGGEKKVAGMGEEKKKRKKREGPFSNYCILFSPLPGKEGGKRVCSRSIEGKNEIRKEEKGEGKRKKRLQSLPAISFLPNLRGGGKKGTNFRVYHKISRERKNGRAGKRKREENGMRMWRPLLLSTNRPEKETEGGRKGKGRLSRMIP